MQWYCDICDKTVKIESKSQHFRSPTHNAFEECIPMIHALDKPDFFDKDGTIIDIITNHNKKIDLNLVKTVFILYFNEEVYHHVKSDLQNIISIFHLKRFL